MGLAIDPAGRVIVADPGNLSTPHTWRIEADGTVTKLAGNGTFGTSGNDGPALQAAIQSSQVAAGPGGDLYLDDLDGYRRVDPDGVIRAFAGTGVEGYSGDGGPALAATFGASAPYLMGVAADGAGNVYLGDPGNHRIRKVDPAGIITTIAGTGTAGHSGDQGPATEAQVGLVGAMTVDDDGSLFFVDGDNSVVRKVDAAGIITTVAGTGVAGFSGDCGPAASAQLDDVSGLAVRDGVLYIVDGLNHRIRIVLL
jgi:serine/threonine-protein kinase